MMKNQFILFVMIQCMIKQSFESLCSSTQPVKHAFNIGLNVFIDDHWFYDTANNKLLNTKYESLHLFGTHVRFRFQWITTGFSLVFNDNDCPKDERGLYCDTINSMKNVVIVIGQINDYPGYGCYNYSKRIGDLQLVEDIDFPWGLKTTGLIDKNFIKMPKNRTNEAYYESMVLVPNRRQLYATVFDGIEAKHRRSHYLYSKILDTNNGKWSDWEFETNTGFHSMFHIKNRVFGVDDSNQMFEFHWNKNDSLSFIRLTNIKQFFNCSESSYPSSGMPFPDTTYTKTTTSTTESIETESSTKAKEETTNNDVITTSIPIQTSDTIETTKHTQTPKTSAKPSKHTSKKTNLTNKPKLITSTETNSINKPKSLFLIIIVIVAILIILLLISSIVLIIFYLRKKKSSQTKRLVLKKSEQKSDSDSG